MFCPRQRSADDATRRAIAPTFDLFVCLRTEPGGDLGLDEAFERLGLADPSHKSETLNENVPVGIVVEVLGINQGRIVRIGGADMLTRAQYVDVDQDNLGTYDSASRKRMAQLAYHSDVRLGRVRRPRYVAEDEGEYDDDDSAEGGHK